MRPIRKNVWFVIAAAIVVTSLISGYIGIRLGAHLIQDRDMGSVSPIPTPARTEATAPTLATSAKVTNTPYPVYTPYLTYTPAATPTLDPNHVEEILRDMDREVEMLDQLASNTTPRKSDDNNDGTMDRKEYDLGEIGYVVKSSRRQNGIFDLVQYDIDDDGNFDVAKFDQDRDSMFDVVFYDLSGDRQADYARSDVNLDGILGKEELYYYNEQRRKWLGVFPGALPPYVPFLPFQFPFPFYYLP